MPKEEISRSRKRIEGIIEDLINPDVLSRTAEIAFFPNTASNLQIEIKGTEVEIRELQEVAESAKLPKVIGLTKIIQELREGFTSQNIGVNQELVFEILGGKNKTLERFSEILSRIRLIKKILSSEKGNEDVIHQISIWEETINEIVENSLSEKDKIEFKKLTELKIHELQTTPSTNNKETYQERFKLLIQNPNALKHLKRYLKPEQGQKFSLDLIGEFFESANLLNTLNLIKRLEKSSNSTTPKGEKVFLPEIDFLEAKRTIKRAFAEAESVKRSNLNLEKKNEKLRELDQTVKDILIACGNKIHVLFPHDDELDYTETSYLKNVLKNEKAICAGKVSAMVALMNFFEIPFNEVLIPRHIFIDTLLPSGNMMIHDMNFETNETGQPNIYYCLEGEIPSEEFYRRGVNNLPKSLQDRVIRRLDRNGRIFYYLAVKEPKYPNEHMRGNIVDKKSPIPLVVLFNSADEFTEDRTNLELKRIREFLLIELAPGELNILDNQELVRHYIQLFKEKRVNPKVLLSIDIDKMIKFLATIELLDKKVFTQVVEILEKEIRRIKSFDSKVVNDLSEIIISNFFPEKDTTSMIKKYVKDLISNKELTRNEILKRIKELTGILGKMNFEIEKLYEILEMLEMTRIQVELGINPNF